MSTSGGHIACLLLLLSVVAVLLLVMPLVSLPHLLALIPGERAHHEHEGLGAPLQHALPLRLVHYAPVPGPLVHLRCSQGRVSVACVRPWWYGWDAVGLGVCMPAVLAV